jgi:hypothetical protein
MMSRKGFPLIGARTFGMSGNTVLNLVPLPPAKTIKSSNVSPVILSHTISLLLFNKWLTATLDSFFMETRHTPLKPLITQNWRILAYT